MDVRHLDLLRELATRGTLAAVAEATHRTPSALSQQLRTAEREFGVRLVEREGRGLRLTAEGRLLAEGAEEVNAALATVRARLDAARGEVGGPVSIGCFPSAGAALLPELVLRFEGTGVELNLDDFDLMEAEYAGRTLDHDIVIAHSLSGEGPAGAERLVRRVLAREPIDVALPAAHPLAARAALRPQDLRGTVWVGVPAGYPFDHLLIAIETAAGERFPRRFRLRDNRLIAALVGREVGLALLPRFTTPLLDGVVLRPLTGLPARRSIVALCRPDRHARPSVRAIVEALVAIGARLSDDIVGPDRYGGARQEEPHDPRTRP